MRVILVVISPTYNEYGKVWKKDSSETRTEIEKNKILKVDCQERRNIFVFNHKNYQNLENLTQDIQKVVQNINESIVVGMFHGQRDDLDTLQSNLNNNVSIVRWKEYHTGDNLGNIVQDFKESSADEGKLFESLWDKLYAEPNRQRANILRAEILGPLVARDLLWQWQQQCQNGEETKGDIENLEKNINGATENIKTPFEKFNNMFPSEDLRKNLEWLAATYDVRNKASKFHEELKTAATTMENLLTDPKPDGGELCPDPAMEASSAITP